MALCTLAEVKTFLGKSSGDTGDDAALNQIIEVVSERLAAEAGRIYRGRPCLEKRTISQLISVRDSRKQLIWLAAWPIVEITEIKEAIFGGFDDVDAMTENEGYQLDADLGGLHRIGFWLKGINSVRASYAGGYTRADAWVGGTASDYSVGDVVSYEDLIYSCKVAVAGSTTAPPDDPDNWDLKTGEVPLPGDIAHAAVIQTVFWFKRRNELGLSSSGVQGGSFSTYARDELLPEVKQVIRKYRRLTG